MDFFPLFHNLRGRRCLVVGAGEVALRKLRQLLEAGAEIDVVALRVSEQVRQLALGQTLSLHERAYLAEDLDGAVLVVAASSDEQLNAQISEQAQQQNIPVNVVDSPELCSVIFPAIVDRSPIQIAISSGGTAPVLVRMLRTKLEAMLPGNYGKLAQLAARYRGAVKEKIDSLSERKNFWEKVFAGDVAELVYSERIDAAEQRLEAHLHSHQSSKVGEVYLVGGGPGDPDLLTFRAVRLMQQADFVLYDRLVSNQVLNLVRRDAELIYVGKKGSEHSVRQENINEKLLELARQGKRVLRLKGGDPFIFGRGGEEIALLAEHGIPFQVVPGITAASGCASYAGIPLTHRDHAQSVRFITGHLINDDPDYATADISWQELTACNQTVVFYMGLPSLAIICRQLINHGMSAATPIALIEKGTTSEQRVFRGSLISLPDIVHAASVKAPTLIIIGGVVALADSLAWFNTQ